jgi:hypothetical protein
VNFFQMKDQNAKNSGLTMTPHLVLINTNRKCGSILPWLNFGVLFCQGSSYGKFGRVVVGLENIRCPVYCLNI